MLINGKEKLERMRDGRAIYIGAERVDDVTRHPAFRNAAQTIAGLYDLKADPGKRELFSFEENGERYGLPWLRCRTREDLARRMRCDEGDRGRHLRHDRTLTRSRRGPDHRAGDEARIARSACARASAKISPAITNSRAGTISISPSR